MEVLRSLSTKLTTTHREKVVHALLLGSVVALGFRSAEQQKEIESLEAQKAALRTSNAAASTAMWSWREELFRLAQSDKPILSASRLRAIYGEDEPASETSSPTMAATENIVSCWTPISRSMSHRVQPVCRHFLCSTSTQVLLLMRHEHSSVLPWLVLDFRWQF